MTGHTLSLRHFAGLIGSIIGHSAAVFLGFVMMVLGLALSVTMIMLPVGLVVGILGFLTFVGGLFAHLGQDS
jgi:hypothetical protein